VNPSFCFFCGRWKILSFFQLCIFFIRVNWTNFANLWGKKSNSFDITKLREERKRKRKSQEPRCYFWGGAVGSVGTLFFSFKFVGLAYQEGKDIVFRFILEYSSLRDFSPLGKNNRSIFYMRIFER
jgi:hypothetical protein